MRTPLRNETSPESGCLLCAEDGEESGFASAVRADEANPIAVVD